MSTDNARALFEEHLEHFMKGVLEMYRQEGRVEAVGIWFAADGRVCPVPLGQMSKNPADYPDAMERAASLLETSGMIRCHQEEGRVVLFWEYGAEKARRFASIDAERRVGAWQDR